MSQRTKKTSHKPRVNFRLLCELDERLTRITTNELAPSAKAVVESHVDAAVASLAAGAGALVCSPTTRAVARELGGCKTAQRPRSFRFDPAKLRTWGAVARKLKTNVAGLVNYALYCGLVLAPVGGGQES